MRMSTVAVISDIHGNAVALDAVLADIDGRGVEEIVCLGDVIACGPVPKAVIARLVERRCRSVLGNTDEWFFGRLLPEPHQRDYDRLMRLIEWGVRAAGDDAHAYVESLPPRLRVDLGSDRLLCFHGSPRSPVEPILAETPDAALGEMLAEHEAAAYACGHTHVQLVRGLGGILVVNAGSVGVPLASEPAATPPAFAEYAVITSHGSGIDAALCRVPVDARDASAAARASGMPHADEWAAILASRDRRSNERARGAYAGDRGA